MKIKHYSIPSDTYKARNYTTHTKLDYKPPLSLYFNGKELQIVEWGEVKRDKSFTLNPFNLSNPKAFITESKDYQIKLDTIPMIIRPRDSYMLNITDTHNSNQATITNTNTQNIINPEIFIDDDFCKLIHILQQYKNQYKASEVKLEVGYENISNYYVDSEGYIQGAGFKLPTDSKGNDVKINLANFIEHGEIGKIRAIILHRTMSKSAQSSVHIYSPEQDKNIFNALHKWAYPAYMSEYIENIDEIMYFFASVQDKKMIMHSGILAQSVAFELYIYKGDAIEACKLLPKDTFDIIYQDAFSPKKNPTLWNTEYFSLLASLLHPQGIITTYSQSATIRQNALNGGLKVYNYESGIVRGGSVMSKIVLTLKGLKPLHL